MNIEQQVISLPLAQRLAQQEIGLTRLMGHMGSESYPSYVSYKSYFVWYPDDDGEEWDIGNTDDGFDGQIPAYTVPELVELLGERFGFIERIPEAVNTQESMRFRAGDVDLYGFRLCAPTPADALGLLLEVVLGGIAQSGVAVVESNPIK
jgi:hypothetical protein